MPTTIHVEGETGVQRAARRLAKKRAAIKLIPNLGIVTRQQRRAIARQAAKGRPSRNEAGTFRYLPLGVR